MADNDQVISENTEEDQLFNIDETIAVPLSEMPTASDQLVPCLGVVWHPDFSRIGDIAFLNTGENAVSELSRALPLFKNINNGTECPLADQRISRKAVMVKYLGRSGFLITPPQSKMLVMVNGRLISEPTTVMLSDLGSDVILTLANSVILSIFMGSATPSNAPLKAGLLGVSAQIQQTWQVIERAGPTDLPVLIKGETGTGKELAAQALHLASGRASEAMVSLNMATLSSELGAADLFGASRGAFTGATRDRMGLFEQATCSSIFLDEIGDAPASIQAMLLRILETGEYRRVGETKLRKTSARVIAATDRALVAKDFSQPLLRRLENIVLTMAPLRERRVDIGLMIIHFLSQQGNLARTPYMAPWIGSLALYSWPGNVRELRNVVQQMAIDQVPEVLKTPMEPEDKVVRLAIAKPKAEYRTKESVTEVEILEALDDNDWSIKDAAAALNISRTILYELMDQAPTIRRVDDLSAEEIKSVIDSTPTGLKDWAKILRVSKEALRRRIKQLGFG